MPRRRRKPVMALLLAALIAPSLPFAAAQTCISLAGSTTCPAFTSASIVPDPYLISLFSFLSSVTDRQSFDTELRQYIGHGYIQEKFVKLFGCSSIDLSNTTDLYARYTMSFICNAIIQNSVTHCGLSTADSRPLCADSCAEFALSEQTILSSPDLCGTPGSKAMSQLRADFTNCALPANSITGSCIAGYTNEPDNCGFQSNLDGLCTYCNSSTVNSTDSCCVTSDVTSRCANVRLPTYSTMQPLFPTATTTTSATSGSATGTGAGSTSNSSRNNGLTGGQIAGIVIGSVIGAILLLGLLICCCLFVRRNKKREESSSLNQPTPPRTGAMVQSSQHPSFQALPGTRVTRMSALEGSPTRDSPKNVSSPSSALGSGRTSTRGGVPAVVAAAALPRRNRAKSEGNLDGSSPESTGYVSPDVPESEQMDSFKDYYSSDEIHPGDLVSTLWAYQPRAPDEFELERGDMIKIIGIWDDGWATGVRVNLRADEWETRRDAQRDSAVSSDPSSPSSGREVKALPLVCVCLPQHWRKTIEGDSTDPPSSDSAP